MVVTSAARRSDVPPVPVALANAAASFDTSPLAAIAPALEELQRDQFRLARQLPAILGSPPARAIIARITGSAAASANVSCTRRDAERSFRHSP